MKKVSQLILFVWSAVFFGVLVYPIPVQAITEFDFLSSDGGSFGSGTTQVTFSSVSLGAADPNRYIIVAVADSETSQANTPNVSVTVGGVAATVVVPRIPTEVPTDNITGIALAVAAVPTGTTGDIVIDWTGGSINRAGIGVWRAVSSQDMTTLHDSDSNVVQNLGAGGSMNVNVDIPADGVAIAYGAGTSGNPSYFFTITGTGITQNFEGVFGGARRHVGGSGEFASESLGHTITLTEGSGSATPGDVAMFGASWDAADDASPGVPGMESTNFKIQFDSVNSGGTDFSSSNNFVVSDTIGEVGTGESDSTNFGIRAGYRQMEESFISISAEPDVNMPSLSGIMANASQASSTWTVITDSPAGYELSIRASTSPALQSVEGVFSDYTPATADPDFAFTVSSTESAFGFTPEGTDITNRFRDDGASCNTGAGDTANACWDGFTTIDALIAESTSANAPSGTDTTVQYRAELGSQKIQEAGNYQATITVTAIAL